MGTFVFNRKEAQMVTQFLIGNMCYLLKINGIPNYESEKIILNVLKNTKGTVIPVDYSKSIKYFESHLLDKHPCFSFVKTHSFKEVLQFKNTFVESLPLSFNALRNKLLFVRDEILTGAFVCDNSKITYHENRDSILAYALYKIFSTDSSLTESLYLVDRFFKGKFSKQIINISDDTLKKLKRLHYLTYHQDNFNRGQITVSREVRELVEQINAKLSNKITVKTKRIHNKKSENIKYFLDKNINDLILGITACSSPKKAFCFSPEMKNKLLDVDKIHRFLSSKTSEYNALYLDALKMYQNI